MTKLEFLKYCFDHKGYAEKACLQALTTIQFEDEESSALFKKVPYTPYVEGGKYWVLVDDKPVHLEGDVNKPPFHMDTLLDLPGDFHGCLKGVPLKTTFGLFLFNVVLFWEVFYGIVPYVNKPFTKKLIEGILSDVMVDDPLPGETVPEGKAGATQCMKFSENCYFLEGAGSYFIKPGGLDILTVDPSITKFLKDQFTLNKDKLGDPVVVTAIIDQAVDMDRKLMLSGPSKNFFINDKFIHTARKRMFLAFGIEPNATGDGWVFISNSLDMGVGPDQIVDVINTAVVGSYSRSMATGEGGSRVKEMLRLVGRSIVSEDDCMSPVGEDVLITEKNKSGWVGSFHIVDGKAILLTKEVLDKAVGKFVKMRVTQFCTTPAPNYCRTCCGEGLGKYGTRVSAEVVLPYTQMMLTRMKAAHSAGGSIVRLDLFTAIKS